MQAWLDGLKNKETNTKASLESNKAKEIADEFQAIPFSKETLEKLCAALELKKNSALLSSDWDNWGNEKITYPDGTEIAAGVTVTEKYLYFIHLLAMETLSKYTEQDAAQSSAGESS